MNAKAQPRFSEQNSKPTPPADNLALPSSMIAAPEVVDQMTNYNTHFFIRKEKTDKVRNLAPLYLRISCKKKVEISLGKSVDPSKWSSPKQCITGTTDEAKAINAFLKTVEVRFHEIHRQLLDKGDTISADILKAQYLGKGEASEGCYAKASGLIMGMRLKWI